MRDIAERFHHLVGLCDRFDHPLKNGTIGVFPETLREAADHIEAQAKRIAELENALERARDYMWYCAKVEYNNNKAEHPTYRRKYHSEMELIDEITKPLDKIKEDE